MTARAKETLVHPKHGSMPARRLLDCVFCLTPAGRILHFHAEQMAIEASVAEIRYTLTDASARPERARCQVIPPFVPEFRA
jgi:hypothetical protein